MPPEEPHPAAEPYNFSYSFKTDDGATSARDEKSDKDGTVTGR